jgi:hypothetical protein
VRKTIYIHPTGRLPIVMRATAPMVAQASRRYMEARGITPHEYRRLAEEIGRLLAGTEMTAAAIRVALGTTADLSAVLYTMCDEGILARGRPVAGWKDRRYGYALFREWFPDVEMGTMDVDEATAELVRAYVSAFGPVTQADAAWWTGLGKTTVRKAVERLESELAVVHAPGLRDGMLLLSRDAEAIGAAADAGAAVVNLLPALDPYLMGYKERARYLNEKHRAWVFDRSGNATSTILIDGRVAGVWDYEEGASSGRPAVKLFLLERVEAAKRERIWAAAANVGRFIADSEVDIVECGSMVPLTERTAGGMMSPLKLS